MLNLLAQGGKWKIVARAFYDRMAVMVPPESPIRTIEDLRGKRVGSPFGFVGHREAIQAQEEAAQARALAASSVTEAELARREAQLATEQANTLRRQLENLQLRQTESGVVVTLGDVLFESGQTELREESMASLVEVVDLLQSEPDKEIRIEGHTDNVPINSARYPSNWELSSARAINVGKFLVRQGIPPERIAVADRPAPLRLPAGCCRQLPAGARA